MNKDSSRLFKQQSQVIVEVKNGFLLKYSQRISGAVACCCELSDPRSVDYLKSLGFTKTPDDGIYSITYEGYRVRRKDKIG